MWALKENWNNCPRITKLGNKMRKEDIFLVGFDQELHGYQEFEVRQEKKRLNLEY